MRLIPEWRTAWRFSTNWAIAIGMVTPDILEYLIDNYTPQNYDTTILRGVLTVVFIARMTYQGKVRRDAR